MRGLAINRGHAIDRGYWLIAIICLGEIGCLSPLASFPALVPTFAKVWHLSNTDAGWISGIFFASYMVSVPVLVGLTDRVDARQVLVAGAVLATVAALGFGLAAQGFWSAIFWRALAGAGLAGTYMPGLKALTDRNDSPNPSRAIALYTASYSLGAAFSFLQAGLVEEAFGWRVASLSAAVGPLVALLLAIFVLRPKPPAGPVAAHAMDFLPVLRNREALGYILAYAGHCFELMALRSWTVAFLGFALAGSTSSFWTPTVTATLVALVGLPASLVGNEVSLRLGRRRTVSFLMIFSFAVSCIVGAATLAPTWVLLTVVLVYAMTVMADSGSITAGAIGAAAAENRGATMAVHSTLGFGTSFLGPLAAGIALDIAGGAHSRAGWEIAFATMGAGAALGPLALHLCRPRRLRMPARVAGDVL